MCVLNFNPLFGLDERKDNEKGEKIHNLALGLGEENLYSLVFLPFFFFIFYSNKKFQILMFYLLVFLSIQT